MKRFLLALVLIGFGERPAAAHIDVPGLDTNGQCVGDADSDASVAINELILAVNNALGGCPELPVTVNFSAMVGDKTFGCGTVYQGIGTGAAQFIASDFRFYISNIRLLTIGGAEVPLTLDEDGIWQTQNVALLDFETGPENGCGEGNMATNTAVHGKVPAGVYTGIKFDVGLPFDLNHINVSTAVSPLNLTALYWSWNEGYKFLRVDTPDNFRFHLGSTGCNGGSPSHPPTICTQPNLPTITLSGFNLAHSVIVADIAALLSDSDINVNQPGSSGGCLSDPDDQDCAPLFHNLGLNFPAGTPGSSPQKLFRVSSAGSEGEHVEVKIAASAEGSGQLIAHPEFDVTQPVPLFLAGCVNGTGDDCTGGTRLFSAGNPGFEPLDEAEPAESLFTVADGTVVTLELTALTDGLKFRGPGGEMLDHVGAMLLLGTTPSFHVDLEAQLELPGGGPPTGIFEAGFKLTTTSGPYQSSDPIRVKFAPSADAGG